MEFEATVPGITAKVQSALNSEDPLILTDAQGNQIVESEGTSPGYVCNHGSLRERDAASPRFGNALCVTGSESAV